MNHYRLRPLLSRLFLLALTGPGLSLPAKTSEWKDTQGTRFRGEPVEVIGPFALFQTSSGGGRRMLLRGMTPEDCLRFHDEISNRTQRADSWIRAKGLATSELIGRTLRLQDKVLVPADLTGIPEPQLLLVLYGSHGEGEAWTMLDNLVAIDRRIQRVYPGLLSTVFIGVRHTEAEHRRMVTEKWLPWLIADFSRERQMALLYHFAPAEGTNMVVLSRDGVPLLSGRATDTVALRKFADELADLLALINPANPQTWKDRVYYLSAVRTKEFAHGANGPLLVGNPLRAAGLRQRGVEKVSARLEIAADGTVSPTLLVDKSIFPAALVAPLTDALRKAVVLPAMEHGVAVAGGLDYELAVPPEDPQAEADASWLGIEARTEVPINPWLVLRPIKVMEDSFADHENANGVVVFKAMDVTGAAVSRTAQTTAFNTDWFAAAGAASVQPKEGDLQHIDETDLIWQRVLARDGYVDLLPHIQNADYTVGYAWAEFESPVATNAWLGIGSDDGLKIWLNGELVHDKWIRRMSRIDDDIVPLHLKAGRNQLLLKIQNATGDWSFIYRLRTSGR